MQLASSTKNIPQIFRAPQPAQSKIAASAPNIAAPAPTATAPGAKGGKAAPIAAAIPPTKVAVIFIASVNEVLTHEVG